MPKRVPKDEKPFRPVAEALVQRVMRTGAAAVERSTSHEEAPRHHPPELARHEPEPRASERVVSLARRESPTLRRPAATTTAVVEQAPLRFPQERFYLSPSEKLEFNAFLLRLSGALGTSVKSSNFMRSLVILCRNAEDAIVKRAGERQGHLYRPANANQVAMADFEERLARILVRALHHAPELPERRRE